MNIEELRVDSVDKANGLVNLLGVIKILAIVRKGVVLSFLILCGGGFAYVLIAIGYHQPLLLTDSSLYVTGA